MALRERESARTARDQEVEHERLEALEGRVLADEATLVAAREEALADADTKVTRERAAALEEYHDELTRREAFLQLKYDVL